MKEFLEKYWDDIKAILDKIYFAIKDFLLANEEAAE